MGDWTASNILQNQGKANFSNMQQNNPPKPTTHDPFANLTSMGSTLPPQHQPRQQQPRPNNPQMTNTSGVSSSGAWGATFQTRPTAAQKSSGWNAGGNFKYQFYQFKTYLKPICKQTQINTNNNSNVLQHLHRHKQEPQKAEHLIIYSMDLAVLDKKKQRKIRKWAI